METEITQIEWLNSVLRSNADSFVRMEEGNAYYNVENTAILDRTKQIYTEDGVKTDAFSTNAKLPSGFMPVIIEQKVNYSLNMNMVGVVKDKDLSDVLGAKWKGELVDRGREAAINSFSVVQMYRENGKIKHKNIPSNQIALCTNCDGDVTTVVRIYSELGTDGKTVKNAEIWAADTVTKFTQKSGSKWKCSVAEKPHSTITASFGGTVESVVPYSWGRPPFAIFRNNSRYRTDLQPVKNDIDAYDFTKSDFYNNLVDFQEVYWKLKNFDGQDLPEFRDMVDYYGAIKVGDDGDAEMITKEIPHEAKKAFLDLQKMDIVKNSMSVDTSQISANATATEIMAAYENMNLKANSFEVEATRFIAQLLWFNDVKDDTDLFLTFDRSQIMNNLETSTLANNSIGAISEKTRLSNDSRVTNVEEEMAQMALENTSSLV